MIRLLEFFRTGHIEGIHLGVTRRDVQHCLGAPDDFLNPQLADNASAWTEADSPIWWYGGVEFVFDRDSATHAEAHLLQCIQFQPYYLYLRRWPTHLQRWIFRSRHGPTHQRLVAALTRARIEYQDTGLETVLYDTRTQTFATTDYPPARSLDVDVESFGTLVLRSGVQVRYAEDDSIIQTQIGGQWMFPGKERFIHW